MSQLASVAAVFVAVGVGLMALGLLWPSMARQSIVWNEADAKEHAAAAANLHGALHGHTEPAGSEPHDDEHESPLSDADLAAAKERFADSQSRLDGARTARRGVARFLHWTGIVLALCGVGIYGAVRVRDGE